MIENVIFDLDGTLLDTSEGIVESAKHTAKEFGYPDLSYSEWLTFVGPPVQNSFMDNYGCDIDEAQRMADSFRDYYKTKALFRAKPYEGIFELCNRLKSNNINMAVATYKREDYAIKLLKHFEFDKYCSPIHGADNNNVLSKTDIVSLCLEEMSATKDNSVLIGDTSHDAIGAMQASIPFIAVTYGFGFRCENEVKEYKNIGVVKRPLEVEKIIL